MPGFTSLYMSLLAWQHGHFCMAIAGLAPLDLYLGLLKVQE